MRSSTYMGSRSNSKASGHWVPDRGYGYQWWTNDDGSFQAIGIFGQDIFIDPKRDLVVVTNADWPLATDGINLGSARAGFLRAVQQSLDAENKAPL